MLWVVATPIGNLEEASPRAVRVLAEAEAILCEDTRRTRELLAALRLPTDPKRLHRLDAHAERGGAAVGRWLARLREGANVALVSDAGTPAVSDPGAELVRQALAEGLPVSPIAGPSALSAFVSVCGFTGEFVAFSGFFPREKKARAELGRCWTGLPRPALAVFFESPQRVVETAAWVAEQASAWGVTRAIFAKELTKRHERVFCGTPAEAAAAVAAEVAREGKLGEWVFALEAGDFYIGNIEKTDDAASPWYAALRCALACGVSASRAAKTVSQEFGVKKNLVYSAALSLEKVDMKNNREKNAAGD